MSPLEIWLVILGLTGVTVATRSFFLVLGERIALPERVQHALRYAPACALAAIIAPELFLTHGALQLDFGNPRLVAGVASVVIFATTRSTLASIFGGMAAFWLAVAWLPG